MKWVASDEDIPTFMALDFPGILEVITLHLSRSRIEDDRKSFAILPVPSEEAESITTMLTPSSGRIYWITSDSFLSTFFDSFLIGKIIEKSMEDST